MPMISKLGVARQITMQAHIACTAAKEAAALPLGAQTEPFSTALNAAHDLLIWVEYAERRGWAQVVRHGHAHIQLINSALDTRTSEGAAA